MSLSARSLAIVIAMIFVSPANNCPDLIMTIKTNWDYHLNLQTGRFHQL